MSSKLNMQDIANLLVAKNDISKEEAESFLVGLFSLIEKGLSVDELTKVKDFGTFKLTHIQERESVDVNTKEKIIIPAHRRVSFTPAQLLKSLVNKPFAHFETTPIHEGVCMQGLSQDSQSSADEEDEEKCIEDEHTIEGARSESVSVATETENNVSFDGTNDLEESFATATVSTSIVENTVEVIGTESSLIDDDTKLEATTEKSSTDIPVNSLPNKSKPKAKTKKSHYLLRIAVVGLFIIFAAGFTYNYYLSSDFSKQVVEISENSKPIEHVAIADTENLSSDPKTIVDSVVTVASSPRKTAKMSPGRTLRLIALDKFGDREFWVYIYMVNKDEIENPNVVPIGQVLELPHKNEYPMNSDSKEDVAKAKKLGDELMKQFK